MRCNRTVALQDVEEPEARAAFIWILGEHGHVIQVRLHLHLLVISLHSHRSKKALRQTPGPRCDPRFEVKKATPDGDGLMCWHAAMTVTSTALLCVSVKSS